MIPLHRPPFGIGTVIHSALASGKTTDLNRLEDACAAIMNCPCAVWVPSARAGISWALRQGVNSSSRVAAPAFTCAVVHEAVVRSGAQLEVVDAAADNFLMPTARLTSSQPVVLCELYGHTYDLPKLSQSATAVPPIRIIDMAMAVPTPALLARLQPHDFTVVSFGPGKSMFTGWGGLGFTRNPELARSVRQARDSILARGDSKLALERTTKIFLRTLAHYPSVYALARKLRGGLPKTNGAEIGSPTGMPAAWSDNATMSAEWRLPATRSDSFLALWNLERSRAFVETRLNLAQRYRDNLKSVQNIICPPPSEFALSHYTVRLKPEIRGRVKELLYQAGIYTVTLWGFLPHLEKSQFPNAFRLSTEVLNLPLSPWMSAEQVNFVCENLIRCVDKTE